MNFDKYFASLNTSVELIDNDGVIYRCLNFDILPDFVFVRPKGSNHYYLARHRESGHDLERYIYRPP